MGTGSRELWMAFGWHANKDATFADIQLQYPRTTPPRGIFQPFREGRHVVFMGFPAESSHVNTKVGAIVSTVQWLYSKLCTYNVLDLHLSNTYWNTDRVKRTENSFSSVFFATRHDAQKVCQLYDKVKAFGETIRVQTRRPPMRHPGLSWDSGRNRAHYQPRNEGSAAKTIFESVHACCARVHCTPYHACLC